MTPRPDRLGKMPVGGRGERRVVVSPMPARSSAPGPEANPGATGR